MAHTPELNIAHQELAPRALERVEKGIRSETEKGRTTGLVETAVKRVGELKSRLDSLPHESEQDSATPAELAKEIAGLEVKFLTRSEADKILLDDTDKPLTDAQKSHVHKAIFAQPTWLQEKIADPKTKPETAAFYSAAMEARKLAEDNAKIEQSLKEQAAWQAHNFDTSHQLADIVNKFLDKPMIGYDAIFKGEIQQGHIADAWQKMDAGSKQQIAELVQNLVSEKSSINNADGTERELRQVLASSPIEKSILDKVLSVVEQNNPQTRFNVIDKFDNQPVKADKKSTTDISKKLINAYLSSK